MAQDWLGGLAVAGRTITLLGGILVNRKSGGIYPQFDEMTDANMLLQNRVWDLKVVAVFGMHLNAVHQVVTVGKPLRGQALTEGGFGHGRFKSGRARPNRSCDFTGRPTGVTTNRRQET